VALTRDKRVPLRLRVLPPAFVLYLASPLDVIPDFIPVIGLIDDADLRLALAPRCPLCRGGTAAVPRRRGDDRDFDAMTR
jgi:Protein of unknown function (DUF1232)